MTPERENNGEEKEKYLSTFDFDLQYRKNQKIREENIDSSVKEMPYKEKLSKTFAIILPSCKTKKSYPELQINEQKIKLYDHERMKSFIKRLWELYQYINPEGINEDFIEISKKVNENRRSFKRDTDNRLKVY